MAAGWPCSWWGWGEWRGRPPSLPGRPRAALGASPRGSPSALLREAGGEGDGLPRSVSRTSPALRPRGPPPRTRPPAADRCLRTQPRRSQAPALPAPPPPGRACFGDSAPGAVATFAAGGGRPVPLLRGAGLGLCSARPGPARRGGTCWRLGQRPGRVSAGTARFLPIVPSVRPAPAGRTPRACPRLLGARAGRG